MKKILRFIMSVFLLFGLTACSQSPAEKIVGEWELIDGSEELNYWDITEDEIIIKSESGEFLSTHGYTITEKEDTGKEKFKLEFTELSSESMGIFEDVFDISIEGYFENENKIIGSTLMRSSSIADFELIRVNEAEEVVSKTDNNLVDEKRKLYSMNSMEYSIPESWTEEIPEEDLRYYYPEEAMLMVAYDPDLDGTASNDTRRADFMEGYSAAFDSFDIISESELIVAGKTAYQYNYNNVISDKEFENSLVIFDYHDGIMSLVMSTLLHSDKDYSNEFESILSSIEFTDKAIR